MFIVIFWINKKEKDVVVIIIGKMYSTEYYVSHTLHPTFLGAFTKLRKATISIILCVRLARPHGTNRLLLDDLHEYFSKIC